ncbi:ESX secretion-associated protein EspG [Nocardia camponoti]|uniref:ESX secretion-associated protein EspG n=1 Tax=Nocardia camponoti TaxID=1616106 RepID=A0A917QTB4_9NOCA|nr:ESX secretion-associated protein EspG [Nocardia camponoti]GGK67494.1 hypothetical protein GCM10011591_44570 [Nocardia camponoti]
MTTWIFPIEDFAALWYAPAADRMLYPLEYLSRFSHMNELLAHRAEVRREWSEQGRLDMDEAEKLTRARQILVAPEAWTEVNGFGQDGAIRFTAARHANHCATAEQSADGERVRLRLTAAEKLTAATAAALPKSPPGTQPPVRFHQADLAPQDPTLVTYSNARTPRDRYRQLRRQPCTSAGTIHLFAGPRDTQGAPQIPATTLEWHDRPGGRYLESGKTTRTIRPGTPRAITEHLTRYLAEILAARADDRFGAYPY